MALLTCCVVGLSSLPSLGLVLSLGKWGSPLPHTVGQVGLAATSEHPHRPDLGRPGEEKRCPHSGEPKKQHLCEEAQEDDSQS